MSELVFEVLIIFLEAFLCKMFCEIFGETRYRGWFAGMQFIMAGICIFAAARIPDSYFIAKEAVAVCVFAVYMFCHDDAHHRNTVYYSETGKTKVYCYSSIYLLLISSGLSQSLCKSPN